jgi:hypothetical protein
MAILKTKFYICQRDQAAPRYRVMTEHGGFKTETAAFARMYRTGADGNQERLPEFTRCTVNSGRYIRMMEHFYE